ALTFEQFEELVRRLEKEERRHPRRYRVRVALLAGLGYAYLLFVLALALAAFALTAWIVLRFQAIWLPGILLGVPAFFIAIGILRALVLGAWAMPGIAVPADQLTPLHDTVERVRTTLRTPPVHRVVLTPHFDAAAGRLPRLGAFGWYRNEVYLGLPLMHVLSPPQLTAIVAHELGHLSRDHAPFSAWVYRVRETWSRLLDRIHARDPWWLRGITRFAEWYGPYFNAYSFVLARGDEYIADRCAVELTDVTTTGEALIATNIFGRFVHERFAPDFMHRAADEPQPPEDAVVQLGARLRDGLSPEEGERWLRQALTEPTEYGDTHPSLADRLAAIGYDPRSRGPERWHPPPVPETAAGAYLGDRLEFWTESLGQFWKANVAPTWAQRYEHAQKTRPRLLALEERASAAPLPESEAWNLVELSVDLKPPEEAIRVLRAFLDPRPDHGLANGILGMLLLEREDRAGVTHVEMALEREPDLLLPGLDALARFARREGRGEDARAYRARISRVHDELTEYFRERQQVRDGDSFLPHDLDPIWVEHLCSPLPDVLDLREAYLVRKDIRHFPKKPLYVLSLVVTVPNLKSRPAGHPYTIPQAVLDQVNFPNHLFVVLHGALPREARRGIERAAGEPVYRR
ncbi:MAG: M48 family metalloprotease, partial [Gemmatimonadota bacterium]